MTIHDSLRQVLENRDTLATLFYEVFFERYPEAKPYFKDVNLKHQAVLLTMALMVVERHATHGYGSTTLYLKYLGHKHHLRGVPPELYPKWAEALLASLEQFHGKQWDQEAAGQWRAALDRAAEVMLAGYREPVHV
jgi:hemoglobin-like flavoprotein